MASSRSQRLAGVLVLLGVFAGLGGAYAWYASRRIDYFVARDLRGLATLTTQIEAAVAQHHGTLRDFAHHGTEPRLVYKGGDDGVAEVFRDFDVIERTIKPRDKNQTPAARETREQKLTRGLPPRLEIAYVLEDETTTRTAHAVVAIDRIIAPLVEQPFLSIFDVVLLAAPDGKVLYQMPTFDAPPLPTVFDNGSDRDAKRQPPTGLVVTDLASVREPDGWRSWAPLDVRGLRGASRRSEVRIMDTDYYLFSQPGSLLASDTSESEASADQKRASRDESGANLLV